MRRYGPVNDDAQGGRPVGRDERDDLADIDAQLARAHAEVETLLEHIAALRARRELLALQAGRAMPSGAQLAGAALTDPTALEQLTATARAAHPAIDGLTRYTVDHDGDHHGWAPRLHLPAHDLQALAAALATWVASYQPHDPPAGRLRHPGHALLDVHTSGHQRHQLWLERTGDQALRPTRGQPSSPEALAKHLKDLAQ